MFGSDNTRKHVVFLLVLSGSVLVAGYVSAEMTGDPVNESSPLASQSEHNLKSSAIDSDDWSTLQYDRGRTGFAENITGPKNRVEEEFRENVDNDGESFGIPAVVDGTIYVTSGAFHGTVIAANSTTGEKMWEVDGLGGEPSTSPTVGPEHVYVTINDGPRSEVFAIDRDQGQVVWNFRGADGDLESTPILVDGIVYAQSSDSYVVDYMYALNARTGEEVWRYQIDDPGNSETTSPGSPAYDSSTGNIYISVSDVENRGYRIVGLNKSTGSPADSFSVDSPTTSGPTVDDGAKFVGTKDGMLHKLDDCRDCDWEILLRSGASIAHSVAVDDEVVYAVSSRSTGDIIHAINRSSGQEEWRFDLPDDGQVYSPPIVNKNRIYLRADWGVNILYKNGTVDVPGKQIRGGYAPALYRGQLYLGGRNGEILAYSQNRTPTETVSLEVSANTTSTVAGGTIQFTVNRSDTRERTNATLLINGTRIQTGSNGTASYTFADPGTFKIRATKMNTTTTGFTSDIVDIRIKERALPTEVTLQPESSTVTTNKSQSFLIVVESASGGVGAYKATVSVANTSVASITSATVFGDPPDTTTAIDIAPDNASVAISTALADTNESGKVSIVNVTLQGHTPGTTNVNLAVSALGNETGREYNITGVSGAKLTVTTVPKIGGFDNRPTDPDGDGIYEDINGNGEANVVDVQAMFANREDKMLTGNPQYFDFNGNGEVNIVDVQALFSELRGKS